MVVRFVPRHGWAVYTKHKVKGKRRRLSKFYKTKTAAIQRLQQIEAFKYYARRGMR
jgi:hypothetical protein